MTANSKTFSRQLQSIVFEGFLDKQSRILKTWRKRWCVLTENYLFTFKEPKAYENPTESVALNTIANISKSDEETHRQFSFKIETGENSFFLGTESNSDREKWMGNIGSLMIRIRGRKPSF